MSIDHCDNFSIYGGNTALLLNGVYAQNDRTSFHADPDGISSGTVIQYDGNSNDNGLEQNLRYIYSSSQNVAGKAFRQWLTAIPSSPDLFPVPVSFRDVSNNILAYVQINTVGGFTVWNVVAGEQYSTSGPVITANAWWHLEFKMSISAGSFEIRIEGRTVLTVTGKNFGAALIAQEEFCLQNHFATWGGQAFAKDLVYWDGSGTQNNDFLGSVIVASLIPNTDVSLNWTPTPSGDAGYQILATTPPQDSTIYLDAPHPSPAAYVGGMTGLTGDITSVKAVMTMVRAAKTDGGDGSLQVGLISSPSLAPATTLGANRPITTAQTYWRDVFEIDPKTLAPWLPSSVDTMHLQINRTT